MSKDSATVNIPKDVIEPIVRQQVCAGVVAALGNPSELIRQVVERALAQKVNRDGKRDSSNCYNDHDLIETVSRIAIHKAVHEAITAWVEENRPVIKEQVQKALARKQSAFARALVDGLSDAVKQSWTFNCQINLKDT